ncbi:MAG: tetratricopeptide repeat protein, partial [Spirochaetaceae bacterium]|nr:tetratricopeptide repeat protein [Spirochaetaceae bacterium]
MHRLRPLLVLTLALGAFSAVAQQPTDPKGLLEYGIDLFGQDRYREAIDSFGRILADPKASAERPEAAYWSVLAYLASGDQATASASIEAFLSAYPTSPRVPDLLYQRGRIFYAKADYEG